MRRDDELEAFRTKYGDAETAKLEADLIKLRRAPNANPLAGFPRWAVVLIVLWVAALETADKLPQLLLSVPRYQAALAEVQAKIIQPELLEAQLDKARNDAKTSAYQPDLAAVQLEKSRFETKTASVQPDLAQAQLDKARNDAKASAFQPDLTEAQLTKAQYDAKAAPYQPVIAENQAKKLINDAAASVFQPKTAEAQLARAANEAEASVYQPKTAATQLVKSVLDTQVAQQEVTITVAKAIEAEQSVAQSQAAMKATRQMFANLSQSDLFKNMGLGAMFAGMAGLDPDLPEVNQILDPKARLNDLTTAMGASSANPPRQQQGTTQLAANAAPALPNTRRPPDPSPATKAAQDVLAWKQKWQAFYNNVPAQDRDIINWLINGNMGWLGASGTDCLAFRPYRESKAALCEKGLAIIKEGVYRASADREFERAFYAR